MTATDQALANLTSVIDRLREGLARDVGDDQLLRDGVIQRFEFTWELTWKCAAKVLAAHGVEASTPRTVRQALDAAGWIDDEAAWLAFPCRNSSHAGTPQARPGARLQRPFFTR
jgi:nucleotidyltransferase substrate binding protein (TIGR01987 family)